MARGRSYYRDREVFRLQIPHDENKKFPPMINLQQCFAKQFLVDAVQRRSDLTMDMCFIHKP